MSDISPFECPICCEFYNDGGNAPTTFNCGHSFCLSHLSEITECPMCRAKLPLKSSVNIALRDGAIAYHAILKKNQVQMSGLPSASAGSQAVAATLPLPPTANTPVATASSTTANTKANNKKKKKKNAKNNKKKHNKSQHGSSSSSAIGKRSNESDNDDEDDSSCSDSDDSVTHVEYTATHTSASAANQSGKKVSIEEEIETSPFLQSMKKQFTDQALQRTAAQLAASKDKDKMHTATIALPHFSNKYIQQTVKAGVQEANRQMPPPPVPPQGKIFSKEELLGPKETWCNRTTISFHNLRRFVTFDCVPGLGEFPADFYKPNFERQFNWVFFATVIECSQACNPMARQRIRVRDIEDNECFIAFYPDEGHFDFTTIRKNHVLCLVNAEKKTFMDGTEGIRVEDLNTVFMVPMTMTNLMNFDECYHRYQDNEKCYHCRAAQGSNRCARCKVASYCSRDCQMAHWEAFHKHQCKGVSQYTAVLEAAAAKLK